MSSGLLECVLLGVGEQGPVDDVGEFPFQESEGFSFGRSCFEASGDECFGVGTYPHLGDRNAVQGGVGLSVAAPVQPEPLVVGRPHWDWCRPCPHGVAPQSM